LVSLGLPITQVVHRDVMAPALSLIWCVLELYRRNDAEND